MEQPFRIKFWTLFLVMVAVVLISQGLLFVCMYFLGIEVEAGKSMIETFQTNDKMAWAKWAIGCSHAMIFIGGPMIYLTIFYAKHKVDFLGQRSFPRVFFILFPLALFFLLPLMQWLSFYVDLWPLPDFLETMDEDMMAELNHLLDMPHWSDLLINLLIVGLLPATGEELLFRGIIQNEVQRRWNSPTLAIWVTAFVFAVFHFQIVGFIPKLLIGAMLGYAYYVSGNLILPMVMHFINNSLATVSYYFADNQNLNIGENNENLPVMTVAVCLTIFFMIMQAIETIRDQKKIEHE